LVAPIGREDRAQAASLFRLTADEQQARWHTIQLLSEYLASGTARKRELIAQELKACRQLYETVWAEMDCAHNSTVGEKTRQNIEQTGIGDQPKKYSAGCNRPILAHVKAEVHSASLRPRLRARSGDTNVPTTLPIQRRVASSWLLWLFRMAALCR
jgi:uncharacterized protein YoaH (UPF0181 family)